MGVKQPKSATGDVSDRSKASKTPRRQYMSSEKRERMIIEQALLYFAECGFEAGLSGLASKLDVSEPLIYRHFPTKQALLDKVLEEYMRFSYNPEWRSVLVDRKLPLIRRMIEFYSIYAERHGVLLDFRLNHYSALQYINFKKIWYERVQVEILNLILAEVRFSLGLPSLIEKLPDNYEIEVLWALHASIGFMLERRLVYEMRGMSDVSEQITNLVELFVDGMRTRFGKAPDGACL